MKIELEPIGFIRTDVEKLPRHWTISDAESTIANDRQYQDNACR